MTSGIRATTETRYQQAAVAQELERSWSVEIRLFGPLCAIDFYALSAGKLAAVIEAKSRTHPYGRYPTVFLNVRKWLALTLAAHGLGVPALYVVRHTDGTHWTPVSDIDASAVTMGGMSTPERYTDYEPVIHVPLSVLRPLTEDPQL
jgi:hypothetical protein